MTVYIEYVLINNFVIDFLILKTLNLVRARKVKKIKTVLGGIAGALISLFYPLLNGGEFFVVIIKIVVAGFLVLTFTDVKGIKDFYVGLVLFLLITFFYLGTTIGVLSIFNIDYKNEVYIAVSALPVYLFSKGITQVYRYVKDKIKLGNCYYNCELVYKDKTLLVVGFLDTGNSVYYQNNPVVIIDKSVFLRLIDKEFPKVFYLPFSSVSEEKKIPAFKIDKLKIYKGKQENIISNVTVGVARVGIGYDLILHPDLLGGDYAQNFSGQVKKVS